MSIRSWLGARIPVISEKRVVTDAEIQAVKSTGIAHRWLVGGDMAWGAIGSATPCTTISGRTAKTIEVAQIAAEASWFAVCPMWALWLGAMLEARIGIPFITWLPFISYPGHLQGAKDADLARQVAGIQYLTGIRVLAPSEK